MFFSKTKAEKEKYQMTTAGMVSGSAA